VAEQTCRSCSAPIIWAESHTTGKPIPLDAAPRADGNLSLVKGVARAYDLEDASLHRERFASHFATCPDADTWRGSTR